VARQVAAVAVLLCLALAAADSALYRAKNSGRNTVRVIADATDAPQVSRGEAEAPG